MNDKINGTSRSVAARIVMEEEEGAEESVGDTMASSILS